MRTLHHFRAAGRESFALVITLAFIVLLTAVMLLFLSQSMGYRSWSNSNFNDFKSNGIGQSALEVVVGDLRQEIANGSTATTYGSGTNTSTLYVPTTNFYAVPQRSGTNYVGGVDMTPNLTRISIHSDPIAYPGIGSRASNVSSVTPAAGGQYVSLARWNRHYLLPRSLAGSSTVDTTPISNFTPPDWVFVTDSGPSVLTAPSTKVIGRYAYAVYDEGGLLDANVAGTPSNTATNTAPHPAPNPYNYLNWGSGMKGSEAFADLTMTNSAGNPILTQTQIDQLIAWRNNATTAANGAFGSYTLPSTAPAVYHDFALNNTNGFMTVNPNVGTTTDQVFVSRQALIAYALAAGWSQDSLQYFATFTRDLDQPNYVPPVGRPMVQSSYNGNAANFGTGNDAYQLDRISATAPTTNAPSDINPPFLSVRVTTAFTRADGTTANVGDPLIKERFPLSRLSLLTSTATATQSQSDPIYRYFGLYRNSASSPWTYNHDPSNTQGIDRLAPTSAKPTVGVTVQGREPDFFELLKAAINVGSVGKGSAYGEDNSGAAAPNGGQATYTSTASAGNLLQARDTLTTLQILQIGANIIDQSKADNFPTRIQLPGDSNPLDIVCGSEDLPYIYRIRNWLDQVSSTQVAYLLQPELWNPYSYGGSSSSSSAATSAATTGRGSSGYVSAANTPKVFRVRLEPDPTVSTTGFPVNMSIDYQYATSVHASLTDDWQATNPNFSLDYPNFRNSISTTPNPVPISFEAGEQNGFWGFREPTLLAGPTLNPNANLNALGNASAIPSTASGLSAATYTDFNTGIKMVGFLMAPPFATSQTQALSYTGTETLAKISVVPNYSTPSPNTIQPVCLRMYLDYQDPSSGNWINYDSGVFSYMNGGATYDATVSHLQLASNKTYAGMLGYFDWCGWVRTDPRTCRWGAIYSEYLNNLPVVDAANNAFGSERADGGISFATHLGPQRSDAGFVGYANYAKAGRGYQHGYAAENSTRQTFQSDGTSGISLLRYNLDPDGIPRRAMGGYVTDNTNGGNLATLNQPLTGLPMAIGSGTVVNPDSNMAGTSLTTSALTPTYGSRPTILHRPFRSVAELGYAFRDTPWGDINFTFPESGDSPLLDVFCVSDTASTYGWVAGRINLNSRQPIALAALLSSTLLDKDSSASSLPVLTQAMASDLAKQLIARTTATTISSLTQGPLASRADLVGTWIGSTASSTSGNNLKTAAAVHTINPDTYYTGFSHDIGTSSVPSINSTPTVALIPRQRNAVMRALVDTGTTRTWNLLIDLIAQSGRFSPTASSLSKFTVEGEKHYWLHIAIDRSTGKITDSQLEAVSE